MNIAVENANLCRKIRYVRTLLKYAKMQQISEMCCNRIFNKTDIPIE